MMSECIQGKTVVERSVALAVRVLTECQLPGERLIEAFERSVALRSKKSLEMFAVRSREKRRKNLEARRRKREGRHYANKMANDLSAVAVEALQMQTNLVSEDGSSSLHS